ncbi:uncharacterized protein [Drosophila tropicalis]|uniref:uncharacterized protein n=1 Tax=Drosophila tropicalis TaxID=46794 RepID=UPI0035AC287B
MVKFMQLNLNHCAAAQSLLAQTVRELDVAILSEPYRVGASSLWAADITGKAAIWTCGKNPLLIQSVQRNNCFVRAKIDDVWLYSCYLAPCLNIREFEAVLDQLSADVRGKTKVVVAGDFNAWSEEWGSSSTNAKGRTVLEAFATSDLVVLNTGSEFTFNRAGYGSVIDVTFTSRQIFNTAKWELCSHYTASDHTAIMCTIGDSPAAAAVTPDKPKMYRVDTLNPETFASTLCFPTMVGDANDLSRKLMAAITAACDSSMAVRRIHSRHKRSVYWWNAGIAEARNRCLRARRCYQRARGQGNFTSLQQEYADRRRLLNRLIKDSKRKCFLDLCNEAEIDIWGMAYKLAMKKLKAIKPAAPLEQHMEHIVKTLFPSTSTRRCYWQQGTCKTTKPLAPMQFLTKPLS